MKCIILLFCVLSIINDPLYSQFTEKLDVSNGFKSFTFKKSPSQIPNIQQDNNPMFPQKNVLFYRYVGKEHTHFNGILIKGIALEFYKNQLFQIRVEFGNFNDEYTVNEFAIVQDALVRNYGAPYVSNKVSPVAKILTSCFWTGNNVMLNHMRMDFEKSPPTQNNSILGYLLFTETILRAQQQADELN